VTSRIAWFGGHNTEGELVTLISFGGSVSTTVMVCSAGGADVLVEASVAVHEIVVVPTG
jgi:hypothetical protein